MQNFIHAKALEGWTPKQIFDYIEWMSPEVLAPLLLAKPEDDIPKHELPGLRQIQRIVKDMAYSDTSGVWMPDDEDISPDDVRRVLDVLAAVIVHTGGRKSSITKDEAARVVRLSKAMPSADPWLVWQVTKLYLISEHKEESTAALDAFLAFKPWQRECVEPYVDAVQKGLVQVAPLVSWLLATHLERAEAQTHYDKDGSYSASFAQLVQALSSGLPDEDIEAVTGMPQGLLDSFRANAPEMVNRAKELRAAINRVHQAVCDKWNQRHPSDMMTVETLEAEYQAYVAAMKQAATDAGPMPKPSLSDFIRHREQEHNRLLLERLMRAASERDRKGWISREGDPDPFEAWRRRRKEKHETQSTREPREKEGGECEDT